MTRYALLLMAAGMLVGADTPKDDAVKKELEKLQGTWATMSIEFAGQKVTEEELIKSRKLTLKGSDYTLKVENETVEGSFVIDPTQKPKTIDLKPRSGLHKGKTLLGIYEVRDGTLKTCLALPGRERPTEFSTKSGTGHQLAVHKREKP